jgi:formate hydrogenlyase subunit 4
MLAENKRYPFDNPTTHLELTMIHEAMLLETSGPTLGMIELAGKINLIAFMGLFAFLILPFDFGITNVFIVGILRFIKITIISIGIGFWETYVTKLRIFKYPVILLSLLTLQILFVIFYKIIQ